MRPRTDCQTKGVLSLISQQGDFVFLRARLCASVGYFCRGRSAWGGSRIAAGLTKSLGYWCRCPGCFLIHAYQLRELALGPHCWSRLGLVSISRCWSKFRFLDLAHGVELWCSTTHSYQTAFSTYGFVTPSKMLMMSNTRPGRRLFC